MEWTVTAWGYFHNFEIKEKIMRLFHQGCCQVKILTLHHVVSTNETGSASNVRSTPSHGGYENGELIRVHYPIDYKDWRIILVPFKDQVWNTLLGKCFAYDESLVRPFVQKIFPRKFRSFKWELRLNILKKLETREEMDASFPYGVNDDEKLKAAVEKRKAESEAGFEAVVDITNDPATEVLVMNLIEFIDLASAKANSFTPSGNEGRMDRIQEELSVLSKDVFSFMASQQNNANCQSRAQDPDIHSPVIQPGAAANTIHVEAEPQVRLVNRKRQSVATGYVVTGSSGEICHGLIVNHDESKVCIEGVLDVHYHVPDAPQGPDTGVDGNS
ncbi:hypothetical protein C5167_042018 [Papaver somniferum]|nr:hypothetical protein C5167_042018 [Papaver somniferum]